MAVDAFIKFTGNKVDIKGESQDSVLSGSKGWSVLKTATFSTAHKASIGTSSLGAGGGKVEFEDFVITKYVDLASPMLFLSLCSGDSIKNAQIVMRKAIGGSGTSGEMGYLIYDFYLLFVTKIDTALEEEGEAPVETVTFAYGATKISYQQQLITGEMKGAPLMQSWSRITNRANTEVSTA